MAQRATQEVATYLRNGSLWVGHFVVGNGELNFGDDRFDSEHGLASLVWAEQTSSTTEADAQMHAWNGAAIPTGASMTNTVPKLDAVVVPLKLAA